MKCTEDSCNKPLMFDTSRGQFSTCVGYFSPEGHDHDDNCVSRRYVCYAGHIKMVSKRNTCSVCNWKGKESCFCHPEGKVDKWP